MCRVYTAEQASLPPHLQARNQLNASLTAFPASDKGSGGGSGGAASTAAPVGGVLGQASTPALLLRKPSDIYLVLLQVRYLVVAAACAQSAAADVLLVAATCASSTVASAEGAAAMCSCSSV